MIESSITLDTLVFSTVSTGSLSSLRRNPDTAIFLGISHKLSDKVINGEKEERVSTIVVASTEQSNPEKVEGVKVVVKFLYNETEESVAVLRQELKVIVDLLGSDENVSKMLNLES